MKNLDPRKENSTFPKSLPFPDTLRAEGVAREEQDAVWSLLDEWKPGEPSADFNDAVMARIRAEENGAAPSRFAHLPMETAGPGWMRRFREWLAGLGAVRGFGLAGALATIVIAAVMLRGPVTPPEEPSPVVAGQEISAQQVEMALEDLQMLDELYSTPVPEDNQNNKI